MRKLSAVEVALLVGSLVVGSGNANALDETTLQTINVTGFSAQPDLSLSYGGISMQSYSNTWNIISWNYDPYIAQVLKCAAAYSSYQPKYPTNFTSQYGWVDGPPDAWGAWVTSSTEVPPASGWVEVNGVTVTYTNYLGFRTTQSTIFRPAIYGDMATLVGVVSHEWGHQGGLSEKWAQAVGDDAAGQYRDTNGSKCQ